MSDLDYEMDSPVQDRGRSRSSSNSSSDSEEGSGGSRSSSSSPSRSPSPSGGRSRSPEVARSSTVAADQSKPSLPDLQGFVKRNISLQFDDLASPINQDKVWNLAKIRYQGRTLIEACVPNSRPSKGARGHLCGCPCEFCTAMLSSLSPSGRTLFTQVQALRDWMPKGKARPRVLLLPAAISQDGEQPPPIAFFGPIKTLKELEKAFGRGVQLHPRILAGNLVNTAPHLSARWAGGATDPLPSSSAGFRIPKLEQGVHLVKDGQVSYDRLKMGDASVSKSAYTASDEVIKCFKDLVAMGKKPLEKRTKDYTAETLMRPPRQYNEVRVPVCPEGMDRLVRMDAASRGKEHALMTVGNALNHVFLAAIKMADPVIGLDDHLPNLQLLVNEIATALPPLYASPADAKTPEEVASGTRGDHHFFVDPEVNSDPEEHWLRKKGEVFLESSAVLKDIFVKAETNRTEDDGPDTVPRSEYLEVCWRLAMLREFSKKVHTHNEELAYKIGRVVQAVAALAPELKTIQDTISGALFPSMGFTRATLMFQRFDQYRNVLSSDFKKFLKHKSSTELLPDGSEKPMMQWFVEDPVGTGEEFADYMAKRPKEKDLFRQRPGGSGGGGGGSSSRSHNNNGPVKKDSGKNRRKNRGTGSSGRVRSPTRFMDDRDTSRRDRERADRKRRHSRDDRDESPKRRRDRKEDKKSGGAGKGKSKGNRSSRKPKRDKSSDRGKASSFSFTGPPPFGRFTSLSSNQWLPASIEDFGHPRSEVIDLISSLGFDTSVLGRVLSLPEGGRTQKCLSA